MTRPTFPLLPPGGADQRTVAERVNGALQGKLNCTGSLTMADTEASVVVEDPRVSVHSVIIVVPRNVAARALRWFVAPGDGQIVVEADAAAVGPAQFDYSIIG